MRNASILDEAVERAARAAYEHGDMEPFWRTASESTRNHYREKMRLALEAALDGHIVVPLKPTEEQMKAAGDAAQKYTWKILTAGGDVEATDYALRSVIYRAMVDAAWLPTPGKDEVHE